jgi:hypothetical protein
MPNKYKRNIKLSKRNKKNDNTEKKTENKKTIKKQNIKKQKGGQMVLKDEGMKRQFLNSVKMKQSDNPEVIEAEEKAKESPLWPGEPPSPDCTIM